MFPQNNLPNPTGGRPRSEELRYRLRSAYIVMIRAYLRQKQNQQPPASPTNQSEVRDV